VADSLRVRTARSSLVTTLATLCIRIVTLVGAVWLVRLLDPAAFGLVAMAIIVLQSTQLVSGLGMRAAVVQSRLERPVLAFHAFILCGGTGLVLFLLVIVNAERLALALGDLEVASLLKWMAWIIIFDALSIIPETLLRRDLLFARHSVALVVPELLYVIMAVSLATQGFGLWSLAYASIARAVLSTVLFWSICPGWAWLRFQVPRVQVLVDLLRYGSKVMITGVFAFVSKNWDNFLVGRLLGAASLGFYSRAFFFGHLPASSLEQVVGNVLFSSYSQLQHDEQRLRLAFVRSVGVVAMFTIPATLGIFAIARPLVPAVLGENWVPMTAALQVLSIAALAGMLPRSAGALFLATGRPGYNARTAALEAVSLVLLSIALVRFGIVGVAFAALGAALICLAYKIYLLERCMPGINRPLLRAISTPLAGGLGMAVVVMLATLCVEGFTGARSTFASLALLVLIGGATYGVILYFLDRPLVAEVLSLLRDTAARK
jgi:O-antigen/teichoic acid export membrane protein